jgi:bacterioferritin-associated ferredoxin
MKNKKFVCLCHDITEEEIIKAIEDGYDDLESLKRFVGVTTGPCQGKTCMMHVIRLLRWKSKLREAKTTTIRPPIDPVSISALLGEEE